MNTAIAPRNTVRAPKRSAVQPLTGMNTASESRYEVTASLRARGLVPMSAAMAGSEVAMTVESMFSMNRATATMSGTMCSRIHGPRRTMIAATPTILGMNDRLCSWICVMAWKMLTTSPITSPTSSSGPATFIARVIA